jgi:hypothetical protein
VQRRKELIVFLLYLFFLGGLCLRWLSTPYYNWDLLIYVASVHSIEEDDVSIVHKETYETVKNYVPDSVYSKLIQGEFRTKAKEDSEFFTHNVNLAKSRPLYIGLIYLLTKFNVNSVFAILLISSLSVFLMGIIVFAWIIKYYGSIYSFILSAAIVLIINFKELARLSTADGLSALFLLLAFYFFIEKKNRMVFFLFLLLGILSRVDNIIFSVISVLFFYFLKESGYTLTNSQAISFIVYSISSFILTFLLFIHNPLRLFNEVLFCNSSTEGNFINYIHQFSYAVIEIFRYPLTQFIMFVLFLAIIIFRSLKSKFLLWLIFLNIFTILIKILVFPHFEIRFFIIHCLLVTILFVIMLREILPQDRKSEMVDLN